MTDNLVGIISSFIAPCIIVYLLFVLKRNIEQCRKKVSGSPMKTVLFCTPRLLLFIGLLVFASCKGNVNVGSEWKDDHINPAIASQVGKLNQQVVDGLATNQPQKIYALGSDQFLTLPKENFSELIKQVSSFFNPSKFIIKNQFYLSNTNENVATSAVSGMEGDHDYKIVFQALTKESVVMVGELVDSSKTLAVLTVYGKYGDNWKLNILQIGVLKMLNLDAIDWYKQSQQDYKAGKFADAVNKFTISANLAKPAKDYWVYQKADDMTAYGTMLFGELKKNLPLPIKYNVGKTSISVFNISPEFAASGYFPSVYYTTSLPMADTSALSGECDKLHAVIGQVLPGIDKVNKGILYHVFQTVPTSANEKNYVFARRLK